MPESDRKAAICLSCSVFRPELTALAERGQLDLRIRYLSSSMHMLPNKLDRRMTELVATEQERGNQVLLVYGDCHPHMHELSQERDVARTRGMHCGEILLGKKRYKELLREHAFLLLPEWAMRWRELLTNLDGLDQTTSKELICERHAKFVYLDTGVRPIPDKALEACADYFGLPLEVEAVSLDHLQSLIDHARQQLEPST